jgi:protein TonB
MPANAQPGPAAAPAFDPGATQTLRTEFIALTSNDELLEQLGHALDGDSAIRHCESVDGVASCVSAKRAHVVMLDAREHAELGGVIERIQLLADSCVVVVFAPAEQTAEIANDIRRSAVFAVLPIPVETHKTAAVLAGARDEALSRLVIATPQARAEPAPPPPRVAAAAPVTPGSMPIPQLAYEPVARPAHELPARRAQPIPTSVPKTVRRRPSPALIFGATALALVVLAAVWMSTRDRDGVLPQITPQAASPRAPQAVAPSTQGPTTPATAPVVLQQGSLEELLVKAQAAFRNRRYTGPGADNALAYYRSVLAQQPDNGEALEGLERIRTVLDARLQAALGERRIDEAAGALAQLRLIDGADPALPAMEAKIVELQVTAALESGNLDRAGLLLRDATQAGKLPPDRAANLRSDLERRQAEAKAERQVAEAARRYAELRAFDPDSVPAGPTSRNASTSTDVAPASLAAGLPTDEAGGGPTTDARASGTGTAEQQSSTRPGQGAATPTATAVRSADFKRTRYVEPVYPKDALKNGVRGDVRLRITVDTDGRVKLAEVISSSPPGVFEESALTAVRRWRFRPIEVDGKPVEASVMTTVVFQPADDARR